MAMKKIKSLCLVGLLFVFACKEKHIEKRTFTGNSPIYMSYEDMRASIKSEAPRPLEKPGKILFYNDRIYVNEFYKGVHVIDNSDPSSPKNIAFINIPGNVDIALNNNTLYADSHTDLVAVDVNDPASITVQSRLNEAFPYAIPDPGNDLLLATIDQEKGVVVGWEVKDITETCVNDDCGRNFHEFQLMEKNNTLAADMTTQSNTREIAGNPGVNGSMSRFMSYDNNLYAICGNNTLKVFNISNAATPSFAGENNIGSGIETLFRYGENLFIGSQTGLFIYSLANPLQPSFVSQFVHARRCDPVVVHNDYAYVTLRGNGECGGVSNELNIIDVKDIRNPQLVRSFEMTEPYGLGIDAATNTLFVCDGSAGLKVYDAANITSAYYIDPLLKSTVTGFTPYDVIPLGNERLVVTSPQGIYQYSFTDVSNLQQLSVIGIGSSQ